MQSGELATKVPDGDRNRLSNAHLRVARSSNDLNAAIHFYRDGLGFDVLSEFKDHDSFDGVMLGHERAAYHLEFTKNHGAIAPIAPDKEQLLVFYLPDKDEWTRAVARILSIGCTAVPPVNPYWNRMGQTFEDPDGYRVVLQHGSWPA